jgi:outer membrane protein assembly factor BamB
MRIFRSTLLAFLCVQVAAAEENSGSNWPSWRGPLDRGSVEGGSYPVHWSADQVLWKVRLPGKGCSTPIVWNQRIYVTAPVDGHDALLAIDWSGNILWQAVFGPESPGKHRNGSGSNPSPVTDGQGVFVCFKSGTLAAVELDGTIRWQTDFVERFGPHNLYWDFGTSPVLTAQDVVLARVHHGESWLAAFDKQTGDLHWKMARNYRTPEEGDNSYTTPLVVDHRGSEALLVWGAEHVTLHAAADGSLLWSCGNFNPEAIGMWPVIASPIISGDVAVVAHGRADRSQPRLHAIRLDGEGDVTDTHRIWDRSDMGTFVPTPAEYQGRIYVLRDRGPLECLDPSTGTTMWRYEMPRSRAAFYASPLIAGGKLYAVRDDGVVFVLNVDGDVELLAENAMGEAIFASPVPVENRLLLRGEQHLFCIAAP